MTKLTSMKQINPSASQLQSEADIKLAVSEYLEYGTNQGKWYADRLQAGEVIEVRGKTRRRIVLCREGTGDFFVLYNGRLIFLECKSKKGRQSLPQAAFQTLIESNGGHYYLIRSVDEIVKILEGYFDHI